MVLAVVIVLVVVALVISCCYCSCPALVISVRGRPDGTDPSIRQEDVEAANKSCDSTTAARCTDSAGIRRSLRVPRCSVNVRWASRTRTDSVGGMSSTCTRGLPHHSGNSVDGDRRYVTSVTSSSSVESRHLAGAGEELASPFEAVVPVVVGHVMTGMRSPVRQTHHRRLWIR